MRGFVTYLMAGILVVLAVDFIAAPMGVGLSKTDWQSVVPASTVQLVDRARKGDRIKAPVTAIDKVPVRYTPEKMMDGCDPAFSPLTESRANFAGRCAV